MTETIKIIFIREILSQLVEPIAFDLYTQGLIKVHQMIAQKYYYHMMWLP